MNYLLLTRDELDIGSITDLVSSDLCGSTSLYVGTTCRPPSLGGKQLISQEFGACESMAEKEMDNICGELRFRWSDIVNIVIYHRIGVVPIGEANVAIGISSSKESTCLEAVAAIIDELRKRVPIWRKEKYDGDVESRDNEQFNEMLCDVQDDNPLPSPSFVQISASETEMVRRIHSFIERKREEIDLNNIVDYINPAILKEVKSESNGDELTNSCARINGNIIKQENSKCHVKVRKIDNKMGPQVQHDYLCALDNLMETTGVNIKQEVDHEIARKTSATRNVLLERARNLEEHLNIQDNEKKNIHQRLKVLEDRLLFLESISPEYHHNVLNKPKEESKTISATETYNVEMGNSLRPKYRRRKVYGVADINQIIESECQRI